MVLHLAHHKSYHPYKKENIERVKRDEAEAKRREELEEERSLQADSEARLDLLRRLADERDSGSKKRKRNRAEPGETDLEKQLAGKGWASSSKSGPSQEEETSRATIVKPQVPETIETDGHINFWADLEKGVDPTVRAMRQGSNAEYMAEKKKEQDKWDSQVTMYLGKSASELRPWYGERDLKNGEDRKKTQDQLLEAAYKDGELKRMTDPLALMASYLKRREEIKKQPIDHFSSTPRPGDTPVVSLLRKRRRRGEAPAYKSYQPEEPGAHDDDAEYGPSKPAIPSAPVPLEEAARARQQSERERAKALKMQARRKQKDLDTPRSSVDGYSNQYNPAESKAARQTRLATVRWDRDRDSYQNRRSPSPDERRHKTSQRYWDR